MSRLGSDTARLFHFIPLFRPILFLFFISSATASHSLPPRRLFSQHMYQGDKGIGNFVHAANYMIPRLLFDAYCPCFLVALWSACFICFYFHLPAQSLLTVGQHWMVTLRRYRYSFLLGGVDGVLAQETGTAVKSMVSFIIIHSFFTLFARSPSHMEPCVIPA